MAKFKNKVNAFGDDPGDNMQKHVTNWKGNGASFPSGKLKRYPGEVANISTGNRRLAKAKYGAGESGTSFRGFNGFSK